MRDEDGPHKCFRADLPHLVQWIERAEPRKVRAVGYILPQGRSCHFRLNFHGVQGVPSSNLGAPTNQNER